jgi:hypothetical protein
MKTLSILAFGLLTLSCGSRSEEPIAKSDMEKIIKHVDDLKIPIDEKLLTEHFPEAVEGDFLVKFPDEMGKIDLLKKGYRSSLAGDREHPVAVIFFVDSTGELYLIPFKNVSRLDRPRRLTKLGDRLYRPESNRSSKGVYGTDLE